MICAGKLVISLYGIMFWTGFFLGSLVLPSLSDKRGRKNLFLICITVNLVCAVTMLVLPSSDYNTSPGLVHFMISIQFVLGFLSAGRVSIGFSYFVELAPKENMALMSSVWNVMEGAIYMWCTIFYRWINKNWHYTIGLSAVQNFIVIVIIYKYLPESPKWFYS